MSSQFDDFADGLMKETLSEAAENFFGARKRLEDGIHDFELAKERLRKVERNVLRELALLHELLLNDEEMIHKFFDALGVKAPHLVHMVPEDGPRRERHSVFALTRAGRYARLLSLTYGDVQQAVERYLHGEYIDAGDGSGRKHITVNYNHLQKQCEALNREVRLVNESQSPSTTLAFVRHMDPELERREELSGAVLNGYTGIDKDMHFPEVECLGMHFLASPDLPPRKNVNGKIQRFAKKMYGEKNEEISALLSAL